MTIDVQELLDDALIELSLDFPIYAQAIFRIGVDLVDEPHTHAVAWTDGKGIYINAAMVKRFNEKGEMHSIDIHGKKRIVNCAIDKYHLMFILAHELMHLIGLTWERGDNIGIPRDVYTKRAEALNDLWNVATDYEINSILYNNKMKDMISNEPKDKVVGAKPDWVLYSEDLNGLTAEEIYAKLLKNIPPFAVCALNGGSKPKNGDGDNNNDKGDGGDNDGNDGDKKDKGNGSGNNNDNGDDKANSNGPKPGQLVDDEGNTYDLDEHLQNLDDVTKNEIINKMSAVFGSTSNGTGSSAIDRMLQTTFKPQPFNWRKALTKYIRGWIKDNYTWNKPSRAGIANGLILPSSGRMPKMHIGVAIDTSGSISNDELNAMMDHLFTILQQFKQFQIDVWCCGSQVYKETFKTFTAMNKKEIYDYTFRSDGGNDMRENFKFIKDKYKGDKLDAFICMSDFYDPLDGDTTTTSPCPVIYMCIDHPNFVPPSLIKGQVYPFVIDKHKNG
jgi:hypothetical protein